MTLADGSQAVIRSVLGDPDFAIGDEVQVTFSPDDVKLLVDDGRSDLNMT